jgi:hypothetical protein
MHKLTSTATTSNITTIFYIAYNSILGQLLLYLIQTLLLLIIIEILTIIIVIIMI